MNVDLSKVRAIVFDLDGTLYDNSRFPFWLVTSRVADTFVFSAERKVRRMMKGMDLDNVDSFYDSFFSHLSDKSRFTAEEARDWYWKVYMEMFPKILHKHYKANAGVEEVFACLDHMNIPTAIYSDYPLVKERVEALGLPSDLCENYWSAPDMGAFKPAIRPMHEIASAMGVEADELLVVGDRVDTDGKSAFSCGAQFIHILKKKNSKDPSSAYVSMHWDEFVQFIMDWE